MPNNQFINLEELSTTTQALLAKINEQSNLKVNKANVNAELEIGVKIAEIEGINIYAPEQIDTSDFINHDDLNNLVNALSPVAYTNDYDDLNNKPTIPAAQVNSDWNATSGVAQILNKPTIPTVTSIYNSSGTEAVNGTAVASAIAGITTTSIGAASSADLRNYVPKMTTAGTETYYIKPDIQAIGYDNTSSNVYNYIMNDHNGITLTQQQYYDANGTSGQSAIIHIAPESTSSVIDFETRTFNNDTGDYDYSKININNDGLEIYTKNIYINGTENSSTFHTIIGGGNIEITNNDLASATRVKNLVNPTSNYDAAHKKYVDDKFNAIPSWARASTKPTYTASEVGALPDTTVIPAAQVNSDWNATSGVAQILNKPTIPTVTSTYSATSTAAMNGVAVSSALSNYAETNYVDTAIAAIEIPAAELDANVESMLDGFSLDYTSNSSSPNVWQGGSY